MARLNDAKIRSMIAEMQKAASCPDTWDQWLDEHDGQTAWIEFPGGELMNPNIVGWLWAWSMQRAIKPELLGPGDRFNANGLEGKISVKTSLVTALLVWNDLPEFRRQIII